MIIHLIVCWACLAIISYLVPVMSAEKAEEAEDPTVDDPLEDEVLLGLRVYLFEVLVFL